MDQSARSKTVDLGNFLLRAARLEDVLAISSIYNYYVKTSSASFSVEEETPEKRIHWFLEQKKRNMPVLVAVSKVDGQVCGYAFAAPFRDRPAYSTTVEVSIGFAKQFTGHGLGRPLMQQLIELCKSHYRLMLALVASDNEGSLRFFQACGFRKVGVMTAAVHKFDRYLDLAIFELDLKSAPLEQREPAHES